MSNVGVNIDVRAPAISTITAQDRPLGIPTVSVESNSVASPDPLVNLQNAVDAAKEIAQAPGDPTATSPNPQEQFVRQFDPTASVQSPITEPAPAVEPTQPASAEDPGMESMRVRAWEIAKTVDRQTVGLPETASDQELEEARVKEFEKMWGHLPLEVESGEDQGKTEEKQNFVEEKTKYWLDTAGDALLKAADSVGGNPTRSGDGPQYNLNEEDVIYKAFDQIGIAIEKGALGSEKVIRKVVDLIKKIGKDQEKASPQPPAENQTL